MELTAKIEALLFFKNEPVAIPWLARTLKTDAEHIHGALLQLREILKNRGVALTITDETVELRTAPEIGTLIESVAKEELEKSLGKAGIETLTIILYYGPVTRAQIDYIRGVNSTYILRHLLVRGLVEKIANPKDARSFLYKHTHDLLGYLGISEVKDLPEYEEVRRELHAFENQTNETSEL